MKPRLSEARSRLLAETIASGSVRILGARCPTARALVRYGLAQWSEPGRIYATAEGRAWREEVRERGPRHTAYVVV